MCLIIYFIYHSNSSQKTRYRQVQKTGHKHGNTKDRAQAWEHKRSGTGMGAQKIGYGYENTKDQVQAWEYKRPGANTGTQRPSTGTY